MNTQSVSALLSAAMTQKGIAQNTLARHLDVDQSTVSRWVRGVAIPPKEIWHVLEDLLDLTPHAIAEAAGHIVIVEEGVEVLPPLVVKAARDLNELDPKARDHIIGLIDRLLRD